MGILQARILKGVAMPSSKGSSYPRDLEVSTPGSSVETQREGAAEEKIRKRRQPFDPLYSEVGLGEGSEGTGQL